MLHNIAVLGLTMAIFILFEYLEFPTYAVTFGMTAWLGGTLYNAITQRHKSVGLKDGNIFYVTAAVFAFLVYCSAMNLEDFALFDVDANK